MGLISEAGRQRSHGMLVVYHKGIAEAAKEHMGDQGIIFLRALTPLRVALAVNWIRVNL